MVTGTVKWFDIERGYGVIVPDAGGEDIFAHYSAIAGYGYRFLRKNQKVQFEVRRERKGPRAANIRRL